MAGKKMSVIGTAFVLASYGAWKSQESKIKTLLPKKVGSYGDIIFQVCSRTVLTPKKLTHTASANYGSHSMLLGKPRLQYVGPMLEEVKLEIVLRADLGVKPRTQLTTLRKMMQDGTAAYLVIGAEPVCELPMVITDMSETWDTILNRGELWQTTVSLTLKEYR